MTDEILKEYKHDFDKLHERVCKIITTLDKDHGTIPPNLHIRLQDKKYCECFIVFRNIEEPLETEHSIEPEVLNNQGEVIHGNS